tara:strand:+ start:450 stop:569 length:120 start_codon:yes stop_codon:yes gene_type:complete
MLGSRETISFPAWLPRPELAQIVWNGIAGVKVVTNVSMV